jgi:hypothetical protein
MEFYGSLQFGNEICFHFGDKDVASFIVQSAEVESGERRSWNIGVMLVDCSQSLTLQKMGFVAGDYFYGFYTVLNARKGHLIPRKPVFDFYANLDHDRLCRIAAENRGSVNYLTIPFGNKKVDILISSVVIDRFNKCVFVYGHVDHGDIKEVFGDKLVVNQVVRIVYDVENHVGFLTANI